ncbi:MAG: M1 family metallopeptidase [Ginsengibacter sp.]
MKKPLIILLSFMSLPSFAQRGYWQQYLHYTIQAQLNDNEKTITGAETIMYQNNSPDTLTYIWFHLYPNAYKDDSTALFRQISNDPAKKNKIEKNFVPGFITNLAFSINGVAATTESHPTLQYIDIIKVLLPQSLLPGDSVTIATPFKVQLPSYFSRSGFADGEFMACQWYPKPAVFDKDGWHEMPYLDMGEFYSEYATYNVNITVPSDYVVAATGKLLTSSESAAYKSMGSYNAAHRDNKPQLYQPAFTGQNKTLSYYADSVPDFAWFADKGFVIEYDTLKLESGRIVDAFTYYHKRKNTAWVNSIDFVKDAVLHYSSWIGEYDYPLVQAVEGPKNNSSGGMEYPTITLITSPDAKTETLDGVIAHEVGHNWFMSMLGTNERDHAWMDEGLNTYYQFRYEAEKYRSNDIFGDKIPAQVKKLDEEDFQAAVYRAMMQIPIHPAMETTAADFTSDEEYGTTEYLKAAEWMFLLERIIGLAEVDKAFQNYFSLWKFKHPDPADMKDAFEEATKKGLTSYFALLNKEDNLVE